MEKIETNSIMISPGTIPAMKSLSILIWAIRPYKISGREGGNKSPMLPDEVIIPREKFSPYFSFNNSGYSRPPKAMMVIPDAPVSEVKKAQAIKIARGIPPGMPRKKD